MKKFKYVVCVQFDFGSVVHKIYKATTITDLVEKAKQENATVLFIKSQEEI